MTKDKTKLTKLIDKIYQLINQVGKKLERITKIKLKKAIGQLHETAFYLLANLAGNKMNSVLRKVNTITKKERTRNQVRRIKS